MNYSKWYDHSFSFCTVHPESVDALFEAAEQHQMRLIAGKVMMDRHAPEALCDSAEKRLC